MATIDEALAEGKRNPTLQDVAKQARRVPPSAIGPTQPVSAAPVAPTLRDVSAEARGMKPSMTGPTTPVERPTLQSAAAEARGVKPSMTGPTQAVNANKNIVSRMLSAPLEELPGKVARGARGVANSGLVKGAGLAAAGAAAYQGLNTDTEQYAKRFGMENTEPGVLRDVGIRALGVASDIGNNLTLGQASRFFRDQQPDAAAPAPAAAPTGPITNASFDETDPATQSQVRVVDNALSSKIDPTPLPGTDLGNGIRRIDGAGSPTFTNVAGAAGVAPTAYEPLTEEQGAARSAARIASMNRAGAIEGDNRLRAMGLRDKGDADYYVTGSGAGQGAQATGLEDPYKNGINGDKGGVQAMIADLQSRSGSLTRTERATLGALMNTAAKAELDAPERAADRAARTEDTKLSLASASQDRALTREQGALDRAAQRDLTKYGYDQRDAVQRERTQMLSTNYEAARQQAQARLTLDERKANDDARSKGEADFMKRFETLAVGPDGKPDQTKLSKMMEMAQNQMAMTAQKAEAFLKANPNDPRAQQVRALHNKIVTQGFGGLGEDDKAQIFAGVQATEAVRRDASLLPWSSSYKDSSTGITKIYKDGKTNVPGMTVSGGLRGQNWILPDSGNRFEILDADEELQNGLRR